ncbi:zinc-binding dehydrogenase [bacterium]|nr:zinc-binding dehydrogenase [bacterium]
MKASYLTGHGGLEVLQYGDIPAPTPGPGQVAVSVKFAALNHLDIWVREGLPGLKLKFPHVLGGDASGTVSALGPGAEGFKVGDKVIVHPGLSCQRCPKCLGGWESLCPEYRILGEHVSGTHAETVVVPSANLFHLPDGVSLEEGAAFPLVFTTAWQMLVRRAQVQPDEWVVVHAAGSGVGSAAIQIAKVFGAHVIATAGSDSKLELAKKLGADRVINYAKEDFAKAVRAIVPGGADVIFDHLGKDYWQGNIRAIRNGGRITLCGATSGGEGVTDLKHVFFRQIQILGSTMGSKADFPRMLSLLAQGKLRAVVDSTFDLARSKEAFTRMADRSVCGKILLRVS